MRTTADELKLLKALAASQLTLELLDDIKDTSMYHRKLKLIVNNYTKALERHTGKAVKAAYSEPELIFQQMVKKMDEMTSKITEDTIEEICNYEPNS